MIKTTLGPRGMDKLVYQSNGKATISNDGATIMKLLDVVHPAAKTLVDIAKSQDDEVGDGTTSVVVLAGELLKQSKNYIEDGVHSSVIIRGYRKACELVFILFYFIYYIHFYNLEINILFFYFRQSKRFENSPLLLIKIILRLFFLYSIIFEEYFQYYFSIYFGLS